MKYVKSLFILLFIILLVLGSALFRYRTGNIDFKDSDATWHVLLTTKCYDETSLLTFGNDGRGAE